MAAAAAASLLRRASSHVARLPQSLLPSISLESSFGLGSSSSGCTPSLPSSFGASMELMAVPKKKVSKYKKKLRNGPKHLKPVPVIVRCSGERGESNGASSS